MKNMMFTIIGSVLGFGCGAAPPEGHSPPRYYGFAFFVPLFVWFYSLATLKDNERWGPISFIISIPMAFLTAGYLISIPYDFDLPGIFYARKMPVVSTILIVIFPIALNATIRIVKSILKSRSNHG